MKIKITDQPGRFLAVFVFGPIILYKGIGFLLCLQYYYSVHILMLGRIHIKYMGHYKFIITLR